MKKLVCGLVGVVLGFAGIDCKSTINEEANNIKYHSNEIRKIIKADPNEDISIFGFEKDVPYSILVLGEDAIKSTIYFDLNKDGKYDFKREFEIPKKLDIWIIPPKPGMEKYKEYYLPRKKGKRMVVCNN